MLEAVDGGGAAQDAYEVIDSNSTFRVNPNNTTTAIEQITARSVKYDVTFIFNVLRKTFLDDGAPGLAAEKVSQVNYICARDHVVACRGDQDQDRSGNLYNYLVVTVGYPAGGPSTEVWIRMDQIGTSGAFAQLDKAWDLVQKMGPVATGDGG